MFGAKQEQVESLYGTKVDVDCSVDTGMRVSINLHLHALQKNINIIVTELATTAQHVVYKAQNKQFWRVLEFQSELRR